MKRINVVLSMAAVILITVTAASAQQESAAAPKLLGRYTVNYASGGHQGEGLETVVAITNRHKKDNSILVQFKDSAGKLVCEAAANMPSDQTKKFATTAPVPPFSAIDYPAFITDAATNPPTTGPCPPFQGRAEIYSTNPNIQVAPFLSADTGGLTVIPVQKGTQATKGGY